MCRLIARSRVLRPLGRIGLLAVCVAAVGSVAPAAAAEPYLEFIEGLRQRRYYDLALDYIREARDQPGVPDDVKVQLPYEEGVTLLKGADSLRNPEKQKAQLDEAAARFEEFVNSAPKDHPLQAEANMQRARIAQSKARVETWQASMPANEGNAEAFRQRAREFIKEARTIYQVAHDDYEKRFKSYPTFIPDDDPRKGQKADVESRYMQAQYDLARTLYDEAQTFAEESDERRKTLDQAVDAFEEMHAKYRSQIAGLFARLWQGKSFEEQGEIRKALGIYNEILDHPGNAGPMQQLQDKARQFRLICLNHPERRDHSLVIDEASAWRSEARARVRTEVGLGITYEMARAYEAIGDDRSTPAAEKAESYRRARDFAQSVARVPGELKGPAIAMVQRLQVKLDVEPGDPKDFDSAYGQANILMSDYDAAKVEFQKAEAAGDEKAKAAAGEKMQVAAEEMARLYRLAIMLARPSLDAEQLAVAYFRLAYAHYVAGENLQAAVLARYVARRYRETNKEVAAETGYIGVAAFATEFNQAKPGQRDFELDQVVRIANQIVEDLPESGKGNDARMTVAQLYRANDQPRQSAEWFDQIPATSELYADAQMQSGLMWWNAFAIASNLPDGEQPEAGELLTLRENAEDRLQTGIDRTENKLASDSQPPETLIFAKRVLAQIRNADGLYKTDGKKTGSLALLTEGPHSVIKAVAVPDGQQRPSGSAAVNSRSNALAAYLALLRAQIGLNDFEGAASTREKLEAVAGSDDAAQLTRIYEQFARGLQDELKQLRQSGQNEKAEATQESFRTFLDDLAGRTDGQTYNSLMWIAETYTGLGDSAREAGDADNREFFDNATKAYDTVLKSAAADPAFLPGPEYLASVKVRLANSQRLQQDFEAAEKTLIEVLAENPMTLDAQRDTAKLFEEWGEATNDAAKLETALVGRKADSIWGWGQTSKRLQIAVQQNPGDEGYLSDLYDAKYKLAETALKLGRLRSDGDEAKKNWQQGRRDLTRFVALQGELPTDRYRRYNELYNELGRELGEPEADLPLSPTIQVSTTGGGGDAKPAAAPAPSPLDNAPKPPADSTSANWPLIIGLLVVLAGVIGGLLWFLNKGGGSGRGRSRRDRRRGGRGGGRDGGKTPAGDRPEGDAAASAEKPAKRQRRASSGRSGSSRRRTASSEEAVAVQDPPAEAAAKPARAARKKAPAEPEGEAKAEAKKERTRRTTRRTRRR